MTAEPTSESTSAPSTMRAFISSGFGAPRTVLSLHPDEPLPTPRPGHVLVRVRAVAVHGGDWRLIRGTPFLIRLLFGHVRIPGCELSGIVESVGPSVSRFQPGDRVMADASESGFGAFANFVSVSENSMTKLPSNVDFRSAAAIVTSALAALQAIRFVGGVTSHDHVLVTGASGGVGHYVIQLARQAGAHVTGVCRDDKADTVRALGAQEVCNWDKLLSQSSSSTNRTEVKPYTVIIDAACYQHPHNLIGPLLRREGRYVLVGGESGLFFRAMAFSWIWQRRFGVKAGVLASKPTVKDLEELVGMLERREIVPHIDSVFKFEQLVDAIEHIENRKVVGKVVVDVDLDNESW